MPDTSYYFAYGSNMLTARLRARTPSATPVGTGYVEGRRLEPRAEEAALDRAEGVGAGYKKDTVLVISNETEGPFALQFDTVVDAATYVATDLRTGLQPYRWYKAFVVAGAVEHDLPMPYVEWLRTAGTTDDPDASRCAQNEAVLFGRWHRQHCNASCGELTQVGKSPDTELASSLVVYSVGF